MTKNRRTLRTREARALLVAAAVVIVGASCEASPPPVEETGAKHPPSSTAPMPGPVSGKPKPKPAPKPTVPSTPTTQAPTTLPPTTQPPSTPTTVPSGGSGRPGVAVNESLIPAARSGFTGPQIIRETYSPGPGDGSAQFRTNCRFSHMAFDDPIVFPGRAGAAHLHIFFGNTGANANSTPESIRTSGNSTCWGGTANRSSYWAPAVIDTATGAPVIADANQSDRDSFLQIYYKTGYEGVLPTTVQNFPEGLRMIAGSATSTGPQPGVVTFTCEGGQSTTAFPTSCAPGRLFVMSIKFPQCWDGRNLDSPDHKSHMAYALGWPDKGCPSSHPVPLAQITQNYRYRVPASGMASWRLSSDMYSGPAGYSAHADWMNGWDRAVFQRVVDNCYRRGLDCGMNLLGDGWELR